MQYLCAALGIAVSSIAAAQSGAMALTKMYSEFRSAVSYVHVAATIMRGPPGDDPDAAEGANWRQSATGICIAKPGFVLTVDHVFPVMTDEPRDLTISVSFGGRTSTTFDGKVIARDPVLDLALIELQDGACPRVLTPASTADPGPGDRLVSLGFPLDYDLSIVDGLLSNKSPKGDLWQSTLPVNPGSSGSPVFDSTGRLVGIVRQVRSWTNEIPFVDAIEEESRPAQSLSFVVPLTAAGEFMRSMLTEHGAVSRAAEIVEDRYSIERTLSASKSFPPKSKRERYDLTYRAREGYRIVSTEIKEHSVNSARGLQISTSADNSAVQVSFELVSGTILDQKRAWFRGVLLVKQELLPKGVQEMR